MEKIGLFYGPEGGSVEKVANTIKELLGKDLVDLHPISSSRADHVNQYKNIIFGLSTIGKHTWDMEIKDDWPGFLPELEKIDYQGKTFALYGLGDHITYALHFVDSLGLVAREILGHGGHIIGRVDPSAYEFTESEAIIDGKFIGLPLDEDYEADKTRERLLSWLETIKKSFQ